MESTLNEEEIEPILKAYFNILRTVKIERGMIGGDTDAYKRLLESIENLVALRESKLTEKVTRVEVITSEGRKYVSYDNKKVSLSIQDEGRTLKIFTNQ